VTVAYHRDRGEPISETKASEFDTLAELGEFADASEAEYIWLFDQKSNGWTCAEMPYLYDVTALKFK
jgi:hypothetical protein